MAQKQIYLDHQHRITCKIDHQATQKKEAKGTDLEKKWTQGGRRRHCAAPRKRTFSLFSLPFRSSWLFPSLSASFLRYAFTLPAWDCSFPSRCINAARAGNGNMKGLLSQGWQVEYIGAARRISVCQSLEEKKSTATKIRQPRGPFPLVRIRVQTKTRSARP